MQFSLYFYRFIEKIPRGLDFYFPYLDKILVFPRSHEDRENHFNQIFTKMWDNGILIYIANV